MDIIVTSTREETGEEIVMGVTVMGEELMIMVATIGDKVVNEEDFHDDEMSVLAELVKCKILAIVGQPAEPDVKSIITLK